MTFLTEIEKIIQKLPQDQKRPKRVKASLSKKGNARGIILHRSIVTKPTSYWHKNRHIVQ
jgi:hypothetical protein